MSLTLRSMRYYRCAWSYMRSMNDNCQGYVGQYRSYTAAPSVTRMALNGTFILSRPLDKQQLLSPSHLLQQNRFFAEKLTNKGDLAESENNDEGEPSLLSISYSGSVGDDDDNDDGDDPIVDETSMNEACGDEIQSLSSSAFDEFAEFESWDEYSFDEPISEFDEDSGQLINDNIDVDPTAFGDDLLPWEVGSDVGDDVKKLVFATKKKEAPVFNSIEDMADHVDVDLHLCEGQSLADLEADMHENFPVHEMATILLEEQGENLLILQVDEQLQDYAKVVVVVSARSGRHLRGMGQRIIKEYKRRRIKLRASEVDGRHDEHWFVARQIPYAIHILRPEAREYYELEKLWAPFGSKLFQEVPDSSMF